ncbi:MAG: TonB-dependent receptor [Myxococcales bacterium]|nr:TonB-dependent receptor [Myxococcales bacterium]
MTSHRRFSAEIAAVLLATHMPIANARADEAAPKATADEAASEGSDPEEPIEVSVIGLSDDALQKVPGSRTLMTAKEVERTAPVTTAELVRRIPSLTVTNEDAHGLRLNIGLRGLDPTRSRSILILEDGVPVAINPYAEPDLYYSTPVDRIRAIELVKGSGAVLFGPQTIGGVINFLTWAPPDKREAASAVEYGSYGFFHGMARYGDAYESSRFMLMADFRRADGPREIGFHSLDLMGKAAFPTGRHGELLVKIGAYDELSQSTYVGLTRDMFEADPEHPTLAPDDEFHVRRLDVSLTHRQRFGENTELRTLAFGYITNRTWRRQRYDRAPIEGIDYQRIEGDPDSLLGGIYFRDESMIRDRHYQVAGFEPVVETRVDAGGVRQTITAGIRGLMEFGQREQRGTDFVTSDAGMAEVYETQRTLALAAYAQDRIAFRDWLLVTPGVRFEYANMQRSTLRELDASGAPRDVDLEGTADTTAVIPGVGMVVGTPDFNGFGGLHVGYAPPRVSSAISPEGRDQELAAERSTNYEAGLRGRPAKGISLEGTAFLMVFQNQIVPGTLSSGEQSELVNGGSTLHRGGEGSATFEFGKLGAWGFDLDLGLRYTYALATFRDGLFEGNKLPYAPEHHGSASLAFDHPIGIGAQASWAFTGPQVTDEVNTEVGDASGRVGEIPFVSALDLGAKYTYAPWGLTATLNVKNAIGDVHIETRRPDGIHTGGFRQIIGGLRWQLPERLSQAH